jgi:hypothetical protein
MSERVERNYNQNQQEQVAAPLLQERRAPQTPMHLTQHGTDGSPRASSRKDENDVGQHAAMCSRSEDNFHSEKRMGLYGGAPLHET